MSTSHTEAPISYELQAREGRQVIVDSTGKVHSWASYTLTSHRDFDLWEQMNEPFHQAGIHLFQLQVWPRTPYWSNVFWSPDGRPVTNPPRAEELNEQVRRILARDPEARFLIRIRTHPDATWRAAHLEEFQPLPEPGPHAGDEAEPYSLMPSLASDLCLSLTRQMVHDHIDWCERQTWRNRIMGYMLLPFGEGGTDIANNGLLFDHSVAMQQAFRDWVGGHHPSIADLREAWQDPAATLDSVSVPTDADWHRKREQEDILHWPDPREVGRELDYFRLQKHLFHRWWRSVMQTAGEAIAERPCLLGLDNYKQPQHGWLLMPGFFGNGDGQTMDRYGNWLIATGCIGVGPLLDMPELDTVWTPGLYYNRNPGFAWEAEGLTDSLNLRGKVNIVEGDFRTWVSRGMDGEPYAADQVADAGVALTPGEAQATFRRAISWAISRNQMFWFCSVCGAHWWYHHEDLQPLLEESRQLIDTSLAMPWQRQRDAICLVIDDESSMHEDFSAGFQYLAVYRQLEEGLAMCGVPYRIHLLSDLRRDDFPDYKCWLFPNLFKIDDEVMELLDQKVLHHGNVAIFGPGTGITDGRTRSAEPASRLFGLPMQLDLKRASRRLLISGTLAGRQLPVTLVTDSHSYGPILTAKAQRLPDEPGLRPLGNAFYYHNLDRPGAFVRERQDAKLIFVPAAPLPAEFLRECARYAGAHIYSEQNAVVHASPGFLSLHVPTAGDWQVALPAPATVTDLATDERLAEKTHQFSVTTTGPETKLFRITSAT